MTLTSQASYRATTEPVAPTPAVAVPSTTEAAEHGRPTTRLGWWRLLVTVRQEQSTRQQYNGHGGEQTPCPMVGPTGATLWS